MSGRHVETIFCDDIRQEIAGKLSFIGVYSASLFVQNFPATLPKLCLAVRVVAEASEPIQEMKLRVLIDEEVLQEIAFDQQQLSAASDSTDNNSGEPSQAHVQVMQFMLVFSPIQFSGPCTLRVRVETDNGELRGVALKVGQVDSDQA